MKTLTFILLLALLPLIASGAESNAFLDQCHRLANLDDNSPVFQRFTKGGFWKDEGMANIYLLALHGRLDDIDQMRKGGAINTADLAGIVLASIVKHDLPLMKSFYGKAVASYFERSGWSVLTFAASCDFKEGVSFLFNFGVDPNTGSDIGPFNVAMANADNSMAQEILEHGYVIERNSKRCHSSKFIVAHSRGNLSRLILSAVESAECSAP